MKHIHLTCKNHPALRWSCKSIAFTPGHGYNGARHIFYLGSIMKEHPDAPDPPECPCPPTDLELAPGETWEDER